MNDKTCKNFEYNTNIKKNENKNLLLNYSNYFKSGLHLVLFSFFLLYYLTCRCKSVKRSLIKQLSIFLCFFFIINLFKL